MASPVVPIVLLMLLAGGKKKKKRPPVTLGELDDVDIQKPDVIFDPSPQKPDDVQVVIFDPFGGPAVSPVSIWADLLSPTPRPNAGYQIQKGDNLSNIVKRALKSELGRNPTNAERRAYLEATVRVRTNWTLYSAASESQSRVSVTDEFGTTSRGTLGSAFTTMGDDWAAALTANVMPARLVRWERGSKGQLVPDSDWRDLGHGVPPRKLGVLWLPDRECAALGNAVFTNEACDWPAALKDALALGAGGVWGGA